MSPLLRSIRAGSMQACTLTRVLAVPRSKGGELLLTIMASLAQQESQSLSQNVKLGLQFRYQNGEVQVNTNHFLGYTKDKDGKLIIDKKEAVIIRRIYREYLEGASIRDIAKGLERDKIKTGGKRYKWHFSTVHGILTNEKYIGDALLQKTITTDFIEKTRIKNDGSYPEYPQYYVTGNHEAIIPRDIFTQVQEEIARRANMSSGNGKRKRLYSSRYALSSLCTCSRCGDIYRRVAWNNRGKRSNVWRCCTRVESGPKACDAPTIPESELQEATIKAINQLLKCSPSMIKTLLDNVRETIVDDNSCELETLDELLKVKQAELVKLTQAKKDYSDLLDEMDILQEKRQKLLVERAEREGVKRRLGELELFIKVTSREITEYDEALVRKYIKEIKIYDYRFQVFFKAGIDLDIDR